MVKKNSPSNLLTFKNFVVYGGVDSRKPKFRVPMHITLTLGFILSILWQSETS